MAERRLTESVPPKNTRMTLQGEQPQPMGVGLVQNAIPFDYDKNLAVPNATALAD